MTTEHRNATEVDGLCGHSRKFEEGAVGGRCRRTRVSARAQSRKGVQMGRKLCLMVSISLLNVSFAGVSLPSLLSPTAPGSPVSVNRKLNLRPSPGGEAGTCERAQTGGDGGGGRAAEISQGGGTIRKAELDNREYRHVVLENKLEAVLISDPETLSGAAALCVAVGQLDDPPHVQGLAHFLEHMVFLGTEKYPEESNFDQFCASCAGYSNAWTSLDHTMFHFLVSHSKLEPALDRFASFFSCPLLSASGTDREIHAVDSENNKNLQDDERREYQLLRCTCDKDHPMARFGSGSYKTLHDEPAALGLDLHAELLQFYRSLYSANLMRLAVIGRAPLDDLEGWVRKMFSPIRNFDVPTLRPWALRSPFGTSWRKQFQIVPVTERRRLSLLFPFPPPHLEYRTKPYQLISHVIGHEGPGSLLAALKELGWATGLSAGPGTTLPQHALFSITVSLTEEGLPRWLAVVQIIFFFLRKLRASSFGERERLWQELDAMQTLNFKYRDKEREDSYSQGIAFAMSYYPISEVLCASDLFYERFDEQQSLRIDDLLDNSLSASNVRLHLCCPEAELPSEYCAHSSSSSSSNEVGSSAGSPPEGPQEAPRAVAASRDHSSADSREAKLRGATEEGAGGGVAGEEEEEEEEEEVQTTEGGLGGGAAAGGKAGAGGTWLFEEWYGTKYQEREITERDEVTWADSSACEELPAVQRLMLPPANRYIAEGEATLLPPNPDGSEATPELLVNSSTMQGWHLQDVSLKTPKASVFLQLNNPICEESPRGAALLRLFLEVIELAINQERYMAEEGGLFLDITNYSFLSPCCGLRLLLHGYSAKLHMLLHDALAVIAELKVSEELFEMAKEKTIVDYRNRRFQQPYCHALISNHRVLEQPFFSNEDRLAEVESLTRSDVEQFKERYLQTLLVEGLAMGNIDAESAAKLFHSVEQRLRMQPPAPLPVVRIAHLQPHTRVRHVQLSPDQDHVDSAVVLYLQVGRQSHKVDATLDLLCQIMDKEAYTQLRTKEQLGYIVCAEVHARWGVTGVRLAVQSVRSPRDIEERIEAFLASFRSFLLELPEDEFQDHLASLVNKKLEPEKQLEAKAGRLFNEVVAHRRVWDRKAQQIAVLRSLTHAELVAFYDEHIAVDAPLRRVVSSMIVGREVAAQHPEVTAASEGVVSVCEAGREAGNEMPFAEFAQAVVRFETPATS